MKKMKMKNAGIELQKFHPKIMLLFTREEKICSLGNLDQVLFLLFWPSVKYFIFNFENVQFFFC